jgi:ribonucleotide reductase beta subunit family protein with ferritin-like domain
MSELSNCPVDERETENYQEIDESGRTRFYDFKIVKKIMETKYFHSEFNYMFQSELVALVALRDNKEVIATILEDDDAYTYALV